MRRTLLSLLLTSSCSPLLAAEFTWLGGGDGKSWTAPANWSPATGTPGSADLAVIKSAGAPSTIVLPAKTPLQALVFDPGALHSCRIEGGLLSLTKGGRITFRKLPKDVGSGQSASQTLASTLQLAGTVQVANLNRHYLGGEKLHLAGSISGQGTVVVGGVRHGIVQLSGDNSAYQGRFVVETGSLMLSNSAALGSGVAPVTLNGGAIVIGARVSTTHDFVVAKNADWDAHGPNGNHEGTITIEQDATLAVKNGGGNTMTWRGVLTGPGDVRFAAHGTTFAGENANTLGGTFFVGGTRGATILARQNGVPVISGPLVMTDHGTLRWSADEQVVDTVPVSFAGTMPTLELRGHRERVGTLNLQGDGQIDLGEATARLAFADSSSTGWDPDKVLLILNGGQERGTIRFGQSDQALTEAQLARIGFVDPAGYPKGTYTAELTSNGTIQATGKTVVPLNLPIDRSAEATDQRKAHYQVPGLANLTGKATPLKKENAVISFYGDSITWGGGYLRVIQSALASGAGTKKLGIKLINHGVNGGGVLALRDGDKGTAHFGNTKPLPFAQSIAADKADLAVIYIGVNDVWWRKTTPEVFEQALRDLVKQVQENRTVPVLATLALLKEQVGQRDPKCDQFAETTRKVALDTGTTLVDLRSAFMACLETESIVVRPGGAWTSDPSWLTHDGVHMNSRGDQLLAEQLAQGIYSALSKKL